MTRRGTLARLGVVGLALSGGLAFAAPASAPALTALARVERGQWQIKTVGSDAAPRSLCIADPRKLIHYGHDLSQCQRFVVTNETDTAAVSFTCHASHGQTTVKVATPHSFNLDTQGIINGAPFEDSYEARRTGDCGARAASR